MKISELTECPKCHTPESIPVVTTQRGLNNSIKIGKCKNIACKHDPGLKELADYEKAKGGKQ